MQRDITGIGNTVNSGAGFDCYQSSMNNQGLSETLYTKTQAASSRQRREFTPKTLEDLGIETSCDLSMTAPHLERQLRGSSSNR